MTSTLTRTSQSQAVAEWCKVFPLQAVETYTGSVTFIKQLTVVAVSTITYLKNAFPEDNYTIDQFGGLKLRVLKKQCEDELAQFLMTSLTQAFDAFDKKYLSQIALCFYEDRCCPENLLEYHLFEYGYGGPGGAGAPCVNVRSGGRGGPETVVTFDALRDRTLQLLRACMVMISNATLPDTYDVSLRLYYNDDAPEGYQAPGFRAAADSGADEVLATSRARLKLGSVHTPAHRLHLYTHHRDMRPPVSESASVVLSQERGELTSSGVPLEPTGAGEGEGEGEGDEGGGVRCECGRGDLDEIMLLCSVCGSYQHATCYGVLPPAPAPASTPPHCCVPCGEREGDIDLVDPGLLKASNRTCYAIFRRALAWLSRSEGAVSVSAVSGAMGLNEGTARKLMRVLKANGVVATDPPADAAAGAQLVRAQLQATLARYFRAAPRPPAPDAADAASQPLPDTDDLASRLLEQSQCSQRSDPLSCVLSPLERVSLQAAANTGAIVEPVAPLDKQDSTLEQYRQALLTSLDVADCPSPSLSPSPALGLEPGRRGGAGARRKRKQDDNNSPAAPARAPRSPGVKVKRSKRQGKLQHE